MLILSTCQKGYPDIPESFACLYRIILADMCIEQQQQQNVYSAIML